MKTEKEQRLEAALRQVHAILNQPVQHSGLEGSATVAILRGDAAAARKAIDAALAHEFPGATTDHTCAHCGRGWWDEIHDHDHAPIEVAN